MRTARVSTRYRRTNIVRCLVTGAGGFIGSHLVEALVSDGQHIRALVQYNSRGGMGHLSEFHRVREKVDVRLGDVRDPRMVLELVEGCDIVYHLAALIGIPYSYHAPTSYVATNVIGTLNILEACRAVGAKRVIVTSTSEVYGTARTTPMTEAHTLQAQSPYAASKIAADKLAEAYHKSFSLPVVVLRPFNTYGPRQSARAIIPTIMVQALAGRREIHIGNVEPARDLTFVGDTVDAFVAAGTAPDVEGEVIHFGQGIAITVRELAAACLRVINVEAEVISTPERVRPPSSEVHLLICDASKARQKLAWKPKTSLEDGLRQTADYIGSRLSAYDPSIYAI